MILLSNEDLWVNTSVLARIGDPDAFCFLVHQDGTRLVIVAADPSDPGAIPVRKEMYDDLPAECGQWIGLEVPEEMAPLLPKSGHLLEAHGVQLSPHILLFDLEDGVPRTFDEIFGEMEYIIVPPMSAWE